MGCGVSKAPSPTLDEGDKDNLSEPKVTPKKAFSPTPAADLQVPHDRGEDNSPRSVTPKSTESEGQTSSMTEDDSSDKPNSPLRIKAIAEQGTSVRSNAPAVETKKGFVAFDIPLNDTQESSLDNLLKKPLPRRLRHLEPLGNAPQITSEMLMEKLEKAEEKRQKALARWKEQAAKRREMAIRRSEQMGDTIPLPQIQKTDDDADVDSVEGEKESDVNKSAENHFLSVPCDENTNWNVETVEDPVQENLLDRRPSEGTDESSNQNNNSVEARNTEKVPAPIQHLVNTSDPWISLLPHEDAVKRIPIRHSQMRAGCYLQAVQEESGEGEEYGDTDESEESEGVIPNSLPAPTRNKQRLNITQTNNSNTINRKVKKCQPAKRKTGSRTKGF
ncbi:hypothetical protein CSKR_106258 [Clonorchis sinensis]|uniref:Uncharacterized protein n=1 Tax=Clonorchis sinensis TaxID=79923 RepID=A0A8T1MUM1_CLOSI|nr:hypothetical protein CSKR_106258 [Clonorchis sinensis]